MKTIFPLLILFGVSFPAQGKYMRPEIEEVPIDRLIANLSRDAGADPANAKIQHQLARSHAMAYARKLGEGEKVQAWEGWKGRDPAAPWFGYEPAHVPFNEVLKSDDAAKVAAAQRHLEAAIAAYQKAQKLAPTDNSIRLGLAWCQDQAGNREAAIEGYRAVLEEAWKKENKSGGGLGNFVYVETAGYLKPLLDPTADAKEIATLEERKKHLLSLPRAVTPLVVPVNAERTDLSDLLDEDARVPFDLDATGRQLEWPWITKEAAWLVHDPRDAGRITSSIQMFGNHTFLLFCTDGYDALSLLDDDRDGQVAGAELEGLALWRDADGDGISQPGEVKPVQSWGIQALSTRGVPHGTGIPFAPRGVTFGDGTTRPTYDLILESK